MPDFSSHSAAGPSSSPNGGGEPREAVADGFWEKLRRLVADNFQNRPLAAWLATAALILILWLRVAAPLADYINRLDEETAALTQTGLKFERSLAKERKRVRAYQDLLTRLRAKAAALPSQSVQALQDQLKKAAGDFAESSGLAVEKTRLLPARTKGKFNLVAIRVKARGPYEAVKKFLASWRGKPALMHVASYSISRESGSSDVALRLECDLAALARR